MKADFIARWADDMELPLAANKPHCLVLQSRRRSHTPSYTRNGMELKQITDVRDLGFLITSNLKFDLHYKSTVKNGNFRIYSKLKILKSNELHVLLRANKCYIRPIMEFATIIFKPCHKKDTDILESVQNNYERKLFMRCYGAG